MKVLLERVSLVRKSWAILELQSEFPDEFDIRGNHTSTTLCVHRNISQNRQSSPNQSHFSNVVLAALPATSHLVENISQTAIGSAVASQEPHFPPEIWSICGQSIRCFLQFGISHTKKDGLIQSEKSTNTLSSSPCTDINSFGMTWAIRRSEIVEEKVG